MTLQIQTSLITYSGWHGQAQLASLWEHPPRNDQHAGILAHMNPLQLRDFQTNRLVHQNVSAILTAVHATGGHVLWMNPPHGSAIHCDFVQDFLSNMATYWLWADACQFDVDDDKSWIFATSLPGMWPLASQCHHGFQCKNTRRQRTNDPHTKIPPALCTRFAKLIVPFVSPDARGLFTLWTDVMTPAPATVDKPSRLPANKITTWTPTM